ncbi:MAG: ribonuclease HIII [Bacilli bacterium]|nr:ribonuclease HIII [Clostridium sp.]MDY2804158.1 ribonuclease HIII [Bacilli bacterium]MED9979050.1 ribonuclease HIII [Bacilli bacterium]
MKNKTITKVIRVDNETKKLMNDFYKDTKRDKTPPYAIFQADTGDTIVTLYESGKAMFQGVSADIEAGMWESIGKDKENIDYFIDREEVKEKKEETTIPIDISSVGSDEVGTGDYYGPIVVTASYVNKDDIPFLTELGVKDSKKLSDEQILKIVPKIIKKIKYKTIMLSNKEYNKNYGKDMNMNKIKAVLHNKVLTEMVKDNEYDYIVVDQFEPESSYYKHLSEVPSPLKGITFITKAEDKCLSVACSSLISRYIFVKEIDKLGDKYGIFLPKGANYYVEDVGIKLVEKYGVNVLKEVAKLNFSNTDRILKEVRK